VGIRAVHDAHSVELENLSEFGVPGLLLFLCAVVGAGAGVIRARRSGPEAAALGVIALTAGAYWLAHSSLDWFWPYPAVTAPVFALLGSACAPALVGSRELAPGRGRLLLASGAVLLAVSTVPPFLSERYVDEAYAVWRSDAGRAYRDLDRARSLNPLSVEPLLAEGAIARANGDRKRAIAAFREATAKRPEEWASYYYLALLHRSRAPRVARRDLAAARERDPNNPQLASLARELRPRAAS
jgi:tetratricopeptide (TPR) repeat protein